MRGMQAEQRVAGHLDQVLQQAFVALAGNPPAVVGEVLGLQAGGAQGGVAVQAQVVGMAQVLQQGGNGGIAERVHGFFLFWVVLIGDSRCPDQTVTLRGGWLV